jgi:RNA polymerase sigma factor (sigma-70 family)
MDTPHALAERLYTTYYMALYSFILRMVRHPRDAEDLTQDTFYKIIRLKEVPSFASPQRERGWLYRIAINTVIDAQRWKQRLPCSSLDASIAAHGETLVDPTTEGDPLEAYDLEAFRSALDGLPDRWREVLLLSAQGYSTPEIAAHLRCSLSAIKMLRTRSRERILHTYQEMTT